MKKKSTKTVSILAGVLFLESLLWSVIGTISASSIGWTVVLFWASLLLMAAGIFGGRYIIFAVGVGLRLPGSIAAIFNNARNIFYVFSSFNPDLSDIVGCCCFFLNTLVSVAALVILFTAVFKREKARQLGILAAVVNAAGFLLYSAGYVALMWGWSVGISGIFGSLLSEAVECASFALSGYVMQTNISNMVTYGVVAKPKDTSDNLEKILKLKDLLDSGIITQEEFDEKKKHILGL